MKQTRTRRRRKTDSGDLRTVLLFYVLPFIVINSIIFYLFTAKPKVEITVGDTEDYLTTTATVRIRSLFPTKNLVIAKDGEAVNAEKLGSKTYSVPIDSNGVLEVSVQNFNGMSAAEFAHINILDDTAPAITEYTLDDEGVITITLADTQSGVDFESVYAVDSQEDQVFPLSEDRSAGEVKFDMDSHGLTLHARDFTGNEVQVTFTSHKDGDKEVLNSIEGTETSILASEQPEETAAVEPAEEESPEAEATEEDPAEDAENDEI